MAQAEWLWVLGNHDPAPPARFAAATHQELELGPFVIFDMNRRRARNPARSPDTYIHARGLSGKGGGCGGGALSPMRRG